MNYLYTEEDLQKLYKEKRTNMWLFILFALLFVASTLTFTFISNYFTRTLWSIIASVVGSIFIIFFIYFLAKFVYLKRTYDEYHTLLTSDGKNIKCEILECSTFITTLPDKSRCYELLTKKDDKETIYYLSELFDTTDFKPGKVVINVSYDYVKGYQYED